MIESVPDLAKTYALPLSAIEWTATLVFSLEYAARLWSAAEHPLLKRGAFFGRLRFLLSFSGLIDLAARAGVQRIILNGSFVTVPSLL